MWGALSHERGMNDKDPRLNKEYSLMPLPASWLQMQSDQVLHVPNALLMDYTLKL